VVKFTNPASCKAELQSCSVPAGGEIRHQKAHLGNRQPRGTPDAGPGRELGPAVLSHGDTTGHLGEVQLLHGSRIKSSVNCGFFNSFSLPSGGLLPPGKQGRGIVQADSARSLILFGAELPCALC